MVDVLLACAGVVAVAVGATGRLLQRASLSMPLLGLVTGVLLGPAVAGALAVPALPDLTEPGHEVTRAALAVSVMAVALRYPVRRLRPRLRAVLLLLVLAMPASAVLTSVLGVAVLGLGTGAALLLGAALAPTDPVLAASAVTGHRAESTLPEEDRQVLSLESGANDGLALPLALLAVAAAGPLTVGDAALESLWQVLGALVVGAAAGWAGGRALRSGERRGSGGGPAALVLTLAVALGVLGLAGLLRVDGVLAVFVAGLVVNGVTTGGERTREESVDEAVNQFLVLPLFVLLGASLPWSDWAEEGWVLVPFVVAVLLLRRVPVVLALHRPLGLPLRGTAYLAWFGPVGVSALFYLSLEAQRLLVDDLVLVAGAAVVAASTLVHGLTAGPGAALYGRAARAAP